MSQVLNISIEQPIREALSYDERWRGEDQGLITAWEVGRKLAVKDLETRDKVLAGELPPLGFKGGQEKSTKVAQKFGTLHYYTQLLGIKGKDLKVDMDRNYALVCSRTLNEVVFTMDPALYCPSSGKEA